MSLNIPSCIVKAATKVTATVDTESLGPRQRTACKNFIKTGVLTNASVSAKIAEGIRREHKQPVVCFDRYDRLRWFNMENKDFHDRLIAACVAQSMGYKPSHQHDWRADYIKSAMDTAHKRLPAGEIYCADSAPFKPILKEVQFPAFDFVLDRYVTLSLMEK